MWFLSGGDALLACLGFWWTFPLASRGVLFLLSRSLFGEDLHGLGLLRAISGFGWRGIFSMLLWYRLFPTRNFTMPIVLLEGLRGRAVSQRQLVLTRTRGASGGAAIMSLVFTGVVATTVLGVTKMLMKGPSPAGFEVDFSAPELLVFFAYFLAVSVVETLHVAIGFAIYLDGRSHVEGWDVELGLRTLAKRLEESAARRSSGVAAFGMGLLALVPVWTKSFTQDSTGDVGIDPRATLEYVLEADEFGGFEERLRIKPKWEWSKEPRSRSRVSGIPEEGTFLGRLGLILFYCIVGAAIGGIVYLVAKAIIERAERGKKIEDDDPANWGIVASALKGGAEALPSDLAGAALALYARGEVARAFGLVYSAGIVSLVEEHEVVVRPSDTESMCLRRAQRVLGFDRVEPFRTITWTWQRAAYARMVPSRDELEAVLSALDALRSSAQASAEVTA